MPGSNRLNSSPNRRLFSQFKKCQGCGLGLAHEDTLCAACGTWQRKKERTTLFNTPSIRRTRPVIPDDESMIRYPEEIR